MKIRYFDIGSIFMWKWPYRFNKSSFNNSNAKKPCISQVIYFNCIDYDCWDLPLHHQILTQTVWIQNLITRVSYHGMIQIIQIPPQWMQNRSILKRPTNFSNNGSAPSTKMKFYCVSSIFNCNSNKWTILLFHFRNPISFGSKTSNIQIQPKEIVVLKW